MVWKIFQFDHKIMRVESNADVKVLDTAGKFTCEPKGGDIIVCLLDPTKPDVKAYIYIWDDWKDPKDILDKIYPDGEFACSQDGKYYNRIYFCPLDGRILTIEQLHEDVMDFFKGRF